MRRARKINRVLAEAYPEARAELDFTNAFELLVATVLSAQTTDRRVNAVTPILFERFPDAHSLAGARQEDVEQIIRPTGFFRSKATNLIAMAGRLAEEFDGEVPESVDALVSLPGVGRKTALVVVGNAFGQPGITVDTHVARLARRLGFVDESVSKDPVKTEHAVGALFERRDWTMLSHHLIWHGRRCCHAKRPACGACVVSRWCPSYGAGPTDPVEAEALLTTQGPA